MGLSERIDRLERALGDPEPEHRVCAPALWGHVCAEPEAPHRGWTFRVSARDEREEAPARVT